MSTNSWLPRQQDTTSYSKSMTFILLGAALGSGICFVLFTVLVQYLWCRHCHDVDAEEGRGGVERRNAGGVTAPVLASLPTFAYWKSKTDGGGSGRWGECAVCLEAVQEGELVRSLPACDHTFHVECIDMWLCSHSTCPLCRATVEPVEVVKGGEGCRSVAVLLPPV